jgi:hypothetical protein
VKFTSCEAWSTARAVNEPNSGEPRLPKLGSFTSSSWSYACVELQNLSLARLTKKNSLCEPNSSSPSRQAELVELPQLIQPKKKKKKLTWLREACILFIYYLGEKEFLFFSMWDNQIS